MLVKGGNMNGAQITTIVLLSVGVLCTALVHGKEKTGKHNVLISIINGGITVLVLWWGGFWL